MHEPAYATQSIESRPLGLLTGGLPAQSQETVLHSFAAGSDGYAPFSGLTNVNGVLYGTTPFGGPDDVGTVFKITTSGTETVLHTFGTGSDGQHPFAGLTNVNGVLYGTTIEGGASGNGTVFKITTSGVETVLYSFAGGSDASLPYHNLTNVNGVLYGTSASGGTILHVGSGCGTVFKVTTSGVESVLYNFGAGSDGCAAYGTLIDVNGVLYGTTAGGGANGDNGTVYKITTAGAENVLYSFEGGNDGSNPSSLTNINGVLYGTTRVGGADDLGTVFKITTSGTEKVLHSFKGGGDGRFPAGDLLTNVNGVLYGTTYDGGAKGNNGTAFKITTSGVKSTIYNFAGSDGGQPEGAMIDVNGVLYGMTSEGGANKIGTVFSLSL